MAQAGHSPAPNTRTVQPRGRIRQSAAACGWFVGRRSRCRGCRLSTAAAGGSRHQTTAGERSDSIGGGKQHGAPDQQALGGQHRGDWHDADGEEHGDGVEGGEEVQEALQAGRHSQQQLVQVDAHARQARQRALAARQAQRLGGEQGAGRGEEEGRRPAEHADPNKTLRRESSDPK